MFLANLSESKLKGTSGRVDKMSSGMGSRSTGGVSQDLSEQRVSASSPGATESSAADNSAHVDNDSALAAAFQILFCNGI